MKTDSRVNPKIAFGSREHSRGMNAIDEIEFYSKLWSPTAGGLMFKRLAKKALKLNPGAKEIADIGTGPGTWAIQLAKVSGKKVKAVDLAPNMLKKANEFATRMGVEIETIEANCENLPFEDKSLDLVTSSSLIHMLDDLVPFFKELKRVVKPGGKALIAGMRRDTWWIIRKLSDFSTNVMRKLNKPLDGMGAVLDASFTKEELESLLNKAGLDSFSIKEGIITLQTTINF